MCGFLLRKTNSFKGKSGLVEHRGPDEQSYFVDEDIELEFSRLTITGTIDGEVPVRSSSGKWVVAFNGEIYNFRTLIETYALPFTNSDTKVIANGLDRFGIDFLRRLRGMYAGVLIDTHSKEVFIFRDPLGEKPMFYSRSDGGLTVASEFTAILKSLEKPLEVNPKAVADFFRFGYVEEPDTFDADIWSVKRGVVLRVENDATFTEVMTLDGFDNSETSLGLPSLMEILDAEVSYTTVPTGLALSAGIDSTSILYAMSKFRNAEFTPLIMNISANGVSEEAALAVQSCKLLGINPHIIQSPSDSELLEVLQSLALANDQPHSDPSGSSYFSIFQTASQNGLKVVLLGHGPDELFWGYPWFNSKLLKSVNGGFHKNSTSRAYWNTPAKNSRLLFYVGVNTEKISHNFSNDPFLNSSNPWTRFRAEMVHSYLSSNGLRQSDRLAMAHGVEPRTPYADSRLYGWAQVNSISSEITFDKFEFRNAVELGPLEFMRNRKKQGFNSPMGNWFKNEEINDLAGDSLRIVLNMDLDWRVRPKLTWLSPSEKYKIIMLGRWLYQFGQ